MSEPWQILRKAGLPLATERTGGVPRPDELAGALRAAIAESPAEPDAEALAAFIFAWHHHWPACFAAALAGDTARVLAWAAAHATDVDRYLKLRRISIENLATVL